MRLTLISIDIFSLSTPYELDAREQNYAKRTDNESFAGR